MAEPAPLRCAWPPHQGWFSMKSFFRAFRYTFEYRWTLILGFICSLFVAVLWGANIGAAYPFIEVVFRGKSLQHWVDEEIAKCQTAIADVDQQIATLKTKAADDPTQAAAAKQEISLLETRRSAEAAALGFRQSLRPFIHNYLPATPYGTLVVIVVGLLVGTMLKDMFLMGNQLLVERSVQLATLNLRRDFFNHALDLDLAALGEKGQGEFTSRFTFDLRTLSQSMQFLFGRATVEPLKMIACLVGAGFICWRLLLFSLILAPPAMFLVQKLAGSIKRANRRAMEEMSNLVGQLTESLDAVQVVKAFTMERYERNRFFARAKEFYFKSMKIAWYNSLIKPTTELLGIGVISVALLAGAYLVLNQETHLLGIRMCDRPLSLAALLVFYGLLAGVSDPARKLADIFHLVQPGVPAAERIFDFLDRPSAIVDPAEPQTVATPHRRIKFDNVSFRYSTGNLVLRDIQLEIPFGETLAIVGPNGCGKSTLANLVQRFYDPSEGSVQLDGVDLRSLRVRDIRSRLGLVSQHTQLFDDTVMNNIRYGSLDATDEEVFAAARRAHAHKFIEERLENGYETMVGPRGNKLSGGQRQRLALARAILRDPEILILDEATSQVDLESEELIHQVLEEFTRGRTSIIITHRLSTLTLADRILVMDAGEILDIGTHAQLMQRCELYQRLHTIQFRQSA